MSVLDWLLPPACVACASVGAVICSECIARFVPASDPADTFVAPDEGTFAGDALTFGTAAFRYGGALRRALAALKYAHASRVAAPIARACLPRFERLRQIAGPCVLVPVPLHVTRQRERGYNQALLLATVLARDADATVAELLTRPQHTTRQHRLGRAARLANMRSAFAAANVPALASVILVDDIATTTATMEVAAATLREAGAAEVYGFAVAREI